MNLAEPNAGSAAPRRRSFPAPFSGRWINVLGWGLLRALDATQALIAFALITLGVALRKHSVSSAVVHPAIRSQIHRAGVRQLPLVTFLAVALGFVIIGQTVFLLSRVGATQYIGMVMVTVVVRELGPLLTAWLILMRVGTAIVIELGTTRALGEIEALEALGIDPIHYLVVPRVLGLALAVFAGTVYLVVIALLGGYLCAFVQNIPIQPGVYLSQLTLALQWEDFPLLTLKTASFGAVIATVTCFHGLARPLRLEEVSQATSQAVVQGLVACMTLDALFLVAYLVL